MNIEEYVNGLELIDNPSKGGKCVVIEKNGQHYYVSLVRLGGEPDLLELIGGRYEVMIFACDDNGTVLSWRDMYCNRTNNPTDDFLRECIKEFLESDQEYEIEETSDTDIEQAMQEIKAERTEYSEEDIDRIKKAYGVK